MSANLQNPLYIYMPGLTFYKSMMIACQLVKHQFAVKRVMVR